MEVIIISGTPATGKKTLAKALSRKLNFKYFELKPLLKKISESYDKKKQCYVVDIKKLNKEVIRIIKNSRQNLIISSHLIHQLPKKYVDLCLITKCSDLKKLKQRLEKREYSIKKIRENLDCEIFDVCLNQAKEKGHRILIVDTAEKIDYSKLTKSIKKVLKKVLNNS